MTRSICSGSMPTQSNGYMLTKFSGSMPTKLKLKCTFVADGYPEPMLELPAYLQQVEEQEQETEYIENDVIRKYQLDYDQSVCMVEKYPEIMQIEGVIQRHNSEEPNQFHIVAPGEGKSVMGIQDLRIPLLQSS